MKKHSVHLRVILSLMVFPAIILLAACGTPQVTEEPTVVALPTVQVDLPEILSVKLDKAEVPKYESVEITLAVDAIYSNPYDVREVSLDGIFTSPDGTQMKAPGFWDGVDSWRIRFTPSRVGTWSYSISVTDANGESSSAEGDFTVTASDLHGWIIPGDSFDSAYSPHYLVHHDGTPFYGVGYCEALNILIDGFDVDDGVGLFDNMKEANANYVVWWPMYTNSIVGSSYDNYSIGNINVIDAVVRDAEKKDIFLVFTIWDHPNLRDDTHAWGDGNWGRNGFSKLSDIDSFFTDDEAWAWQENMYRYIIARWGYSTSIGMWQTVSEINGTNAYDQTDAWHEKLNKYFVENDPYRHPTTASGSGEVDWPTGHTVMDMPQMHVYDFPNNDVIRSAAIIADWTQRILESADSPNWVGEFGVPDNSAYPEMFHHSIWAALSSGASMTPAEWNSGGSWGRMTPEMYEDLKHLANFVQDIPLAKWNPSALQIAISEDQIRGWGIAGDGGGLFWVQDHSLEGKPIDEVRSSMPQRTGVQIEVTGLAPGVYSILPYDTWQGVYLESFDIECTSAACVIELPEFKSDMAFKMIMILNK
ncbi:MAG TPA: DUF5060 domain-containing protein [Anaerolineales bacterium]|nr:DUF5060 domain-containing protein [Anaerolineales bacterium]